MFHLSCFEMNDTPERLILVNGHRYLICYVTQCIKQVNVLRALTVQIFSILFDDPLAAAVVTTRKKITILKLNVTVS